jgi:hypothetical protein
MLYVLFSIFSTKKQGLKSALDISVPSQRGYNFREDVVSSTLSITLKIVLLPH